MIKRLFTFVFAVLFAFAGVCAPARAAGKITFSPAGTSCTLFDAIAWDNSTGNLTITCNACSAQGAGTFSIWGLDDARPTASVNGSVTVTFYRGAGCAGAYRLHYGLAGISLTGWTFNGTQSNGYVDFADGQSIATAVLKTGTTAGTFLLVLAAAVPSATIDARNMWIDVR